MRRWQGWRWGVGVALSVGVLLALVPGVAGAAEAPVDTRPELGIAVYTEYAGVVVPVGEAVRLGLTAAHLTFLIAVTLVCFAVCYACFMRQEIRWT